MNFGGRDEVVKKRQRTGLEKRAQPNEDRGRFSRAQII